MGNPQLNQATAQPPARIKAIDPDTGSERILDAKTEIRNYLSQGCPMVIVDLLGARYVSSELLNFLLLCEMDCQRNGATLKVRDVAPDLLRVFRFAGLNQVIDFSA
ncbi:MAG: STAS domain-containing protein [Candidatus Omnitrophica bacterium]|nr:STAS domain-containing protein [Candidatus Omnitrophota bacterium]